MKLAGTDRPSPAKTSDYVAELEAKLDHLQHDLDMLREAHDCRQYHVERVEEELKLAARLQRDFLPKSLPNHGNVQFNRLYRPAGHVSGDLYDVRRLDEEWCGVYLADAIGHGMPAALLAMFMHNALSTKKIDAAAGPSGYELLDSAEAMRRLNETLCGQGLTHATFATALYARVHVKSGLVDLARGGHPYPLLIRDGGDVEEVGDDGALLGIMPREQF
ncbi:MAG: SpoIIE family protein phosphatase, partial [Planctomycetota bacterium]